MRGSRPKSLAQAAVATTLLRSRKSHSYAVVESEHPSHGNNIPGTHADSAKPKPVWRQLDNNLVTACRQMVYLLPQPSCRGLLSWRVRGDLPWVHALLVI